MKLNTATQKIFHLALILALICKVSASTDPNAWEKLNLGSTQIPGATVYYEKSLEGKLAAFERLYTQYLSQIHELKEVRLDEEKIIPEIYDIVGPAQVDIRKQLKSITEISSPLSAQNPTFYLVMKKTVKDYLRKGGRLPCMTYDRETDTVTQYFGIVANSVDSKLTVANYFSGEKGLMLLIPIDKEESFGKDVEEYFGLLMQSFRWGALLHELIESAILDRWKPQGPYWRWFSDGFANAITIEILKKYAGTKNAEEFAKAYDVSDYKEMEKEINLRYWMGPIFCMKTPLEYESELAVARYAYATHEAQRLIAKHGIACVRKILDEVGAKKSRSSEDLVQTVKKVTGEDMYQRLARYQTFATREEGIPKYTVLFDLASKKDDYQQMLINLLRLMELNQFQISYDYLQSWTMGAWLLFMMGYEQAGDEAMQNCMRLVEQSPVPHGRQAAMEMFIIYALECEKPQKALKVAEELLKTKPDALLPLTVQMLVDAQTGRLEEAKQTAKKIHSLAKSEQSFSYKEACKVLAIDPNEAD